MCVTEITQTDMRCNGLLGTITVKQRVSSRGLTVWLRAVRKLPRHVQLMTDKQEKHDENPPKKEMA